MNATKMLIDAIVGQGPPIDLNACLELENKGWLRFTGNQHNPSWEWDAKKLKDMSHQDLVLVYDDPMSLLKKGQT